MELSKLRELIATLRELGVAKYSYSGAQDSIELELGEQDVAAAVVAAPAVVPLPAPSRPERSPELTAALRRLDPRYSDPALIEIR